MIASVGKPGDGVPNDVAMWRCGDVAMWTVPIPVNWDPGSKNVLAIRYSNTFAQEPFIRFLSKFAGFADRYATPGFRMSLKDGEQRGWQSSQE